MDSPLGQSEESCLGWNYLGERGGFSRLDRDLVKVADGNKLMIDDCCWPSASGSSGYGALEYT